MNDPFLKNYRALLLGGIISMGLVMVLMGVGFIRYVSEPILIVLNIFTFILCCLALSFLIHKFTVYKVLGLLSLLVASLLADYYLKVFNPISIPLGVLFWLGVIYCTIPKNLDSDLS